MVLCASGKNQIQSQKLLPDFPLLDISARYDSQQGILQRYSPDYYLSLGCLTFFGAEWSCCLWKECELHQREIPIKSE